LSCNEGCSLHFVKTRKPGNRLWYFGWLSSLTVLVVSDMSQYQGEVSRKLDVLSN